MHARADGEELGTTEVLAFVDYLVANDFIQIYIEGGEPQCGPTSTASSSIAAAS